MSILTPLRNNAQKQAITQAQSLPAPVKGWNQRDSIADMEPTFALRLDNWFPQEDKIILRNGYTSHVTGITGNIETLMCHRTFTGTETLFAAANSAIYNVTSAGSVGSAVVSSLTNDRWQHVNFGTSGGNFLVMCNGEDAVRTYDGSSWATPTLTGATSANLIHVNAHKRRLFFIEKSKLSFWHHNSVESTAGAYSEYPLYSLCTLGGYTMAMGTWTIDAGNGIDDMAVFVTSQGEVLVFAGTDPGNADKWSLVGVYRTGKPIGRRCLVRLGGDLIIITESGFIPVSKLMQTNNPQALSENIRKAVNEAATSYSGKYGWEAIDYPKHNMVIFNIPVDDSEDSSLNSYQYVMNTVTGAWCRFTKIPSVCFEECGGSIYFGSNTKVWKFWDGNNDDSDSITGDAKQAFSYFHPPSRLKYFKMIRPLLQSDGTPQPEILINTDFEDDATGSTPTSVGSTASSWDTAVWDTATWGGEEDVHKGWTSVQGVGYNASYRMRVATSTVEISWLSTDWLYEVGGFV